MKFIHIRTIAIGLILAQLFLFLYFPLALSWPGWGDCTDYHKVTYLTPLYKDDVGITLDGIASESIWTDQYNDNGTLSVPLAGEIGTPGFYVVILNLTFVMDDQYLYILCQWKDNSTKPDLGGNYYDGLYFCWNINVPNFSAYFDDGMVTAEMGGGDVDCWEWTCLEGSPSNGSSYFCRDTCFGTTGWYDPSLEIKDVQIGYTYRANDSYTLELRRKLVTNDNYDVQFNENKLYKFNLGIMNDGSHEDHAVSWTFALDLRRDEVPPIISNYYIPIILIICTITIFLILLNKKSIFTLS